MITIGDNPQKLKGINKFITKTEHEGLRGKILAIHISGTKAIILCMNTSFDGDCKWGNLYLIKEKDADSYPDLVKRVKEIPSTKQWKII